MGVTGGTGNQIVRAWTNPNAPTGESRMYQTADGTVWREVISQTYRGTGDRQGVIRGGRINERH